MKYLLSAGQMELDLFDLRFVSFHCSFHHGWIEWHRNEKLQHLFRFSNAGKFVVCHLILDSGIMNWKQKQCSQIESQVIRIPSEQGNVVHYLMSGMYIPTYSEIDCGIHEVSIWCSTPTYVRFSFYRKWSETQTENKSVLGVLFTDSIPNNSSSTHVESKYSNKIRYKTSRQKFEFERLSLKLNLYVNHFCTYLFFGSRWHCVVEYIMMNFVSWKNEFKKQERKHDWKSSVCIFDRVEEIHETKV